MHKKSKDAARTDGAARTEDPVRDPPRQTESVQRPKETVQRAVPRQTARREAVRAQGCPRDPQQPPGADDHVTARREVLSPSADTEKQEQMP